MSFWNTLQTMVSECEIKIDRPKDTAHPRYPEYIYPFDYGYLDGTTSREGDGIDCWVGSLGGNQVTGMVTVVDGVKKDSEVKILLGCTEEDMQVILQCHNKGAMCGMLQVRDSRVGPKLIPELKVSGYEKSLNFYINACGFHIAYDRPEEEFAMLEREGARVMIESIAEDSRAWLTGDMEAPFGRGINFQVEVSNVEEMVSLLKQNNVELYVDVEEKWYRSGEMELGNKQFLVQDPDGYLLRFFEDLGERKI